MKKIITLSRSSNGGFTALIAVILLASGITAFSLATLDSALLYADQVKQRESRIQARLNAKACLDTVKLMAAKDYFLNGTTTIGEFGCIAMVSNDFVGHFSFQVTSIFNGVSVREDGEL